jgi:hypothetical protein
VTIRDHIQRRFRALALIFALPYAALQLLRIVIRHWPGALPARSSHLVLGLSQPRVFWIVVAWFAFKVITIPCPRCSRPLGGAVAVIWGSRRVNRCPHCRVSLDEPVKAANPG